jgi:hypothetical protein
MPYGHSQGAWDSFTQQKRNRLKSEWNAAHAPGTTIDVGDGGTGDPADYEGFNRIPGHIPQYPAEPNYDTSLADDGSGSGSGSGGFAAAPVRILAESPEWLAYLNALGLEEAQFRADTDKSRGMFQSDAERQEQDLTPVYEQSRRGIAGGMETRGMSRSGEQLRKLAENRGQEGRQKAGIKAQLGMQIGSLESQLAQKLLDINARKASQELQLRSQGYQ